MEEIKNLNSIIEKKAEEKLENDITNYLFLITENPLFSAIKNETVNISKENKECNTKSLHTFFFGDNSIAGTLIKKQFLPKYIEEESKLFYEKVMDFNNSQETEE